MKKIVLTCFSLMICLTACGTPLQPPSDLTREPALPTQTLLAQLEPVATLQEPGAVSTPTGQGSLFVNIYHSTDMLHLECDPLEIIFDVTVNNPDVSSVTFFFRMKDKATAIASDWSNGEKMKTPGNGNFEFIQRASAIPDEARYKEAWLQYQFVAEDKSEQAVGRSQIFEKGITFTADCP